MQATLNTKLLEGLHISNCKSLSTAIKICGAISLSVLVNLTISGCVVSPSIASAGDVPCYTKKGILFRQGGGRFYAQMFSYNTVHFTRHLTGSLQQFRSK